MPVKLNNKLAPESAEARIEIIPLIDIMFFLLASFMLVSLSMVNLNSVKVNLPTATTATPQSAKDIADVSVDRAGAVFLNKKPVGDNELALNLAASERANPKLRVLITGDLNARHGDVVHALDIVRSVGIDKISIETRKPIKGTIP